MEVHEAERGRSGERPTGLLQHLAAEGGDEGCIALAPATRDDMPRRAFAHREYPVATEDHGAHRGDIRQRREFIAQVTGDAQREGAATPHLALPRDRGATGQKIGEVGLYPTTLRIVEVAGVHCPLYEIWYRVERDARTSRAAMLLRACLVPAPGDTGCTWKAP